MRDTEIDRDVAVTKVSAAGSVTKGDLVKVSVTVERLGRQGIPDDVTVTLSDETDDVAIRTTVGHGSKRTFGRLDMVDANFDWDTSGASIGDHVLTACHDVEDEDPDRKLWAALSTLAAALVSWWGYRRYKGSKAESP